MQFIKHDINFDFIGKRKIGFGFSFAIILIGLISLVMHNGPKLGIDFAGGTNIRVQFSKEIPISKIRKGFTAIGLEKASVQKVGKTSEHEFQISTAKPEMTEKGFTQSISDALESTTGEIPIIRQVDMVGPQAGKDLRKSALLAIFYSLLFITIYISGRFELKWILSGITAGALMTAVYFLSAFNVSMSVIIPAALVISLILFWRLKLNYAMSAIIALIHDIFITIGIFSILGYEFSLPIIAALLTIIGYSLNDTIIVFDRIRENIADDKNKPLSEIINKSINETLSRTVLTSLTTLIVLFALFFLGGEIIHNFTFAMIVGVLIGTYSSIFVASPLILISNKGE
ncbi:MAG: protein translocase subunit SecF [Desulfobacteraceae bacterium]|nr:protein translocase subunit SecF [Desulfobacteraceae bacterium]